MALGTVGSDPDKVFKRTRRSEAALGWLLPVFAAAAASGLHVPSHLPSSVGALSEDGWICEPFLAGRPATETGRSGLVDVLAATRARTCSLPQRPGFLGARDLLTADAGGDVDIRALPPDLVRQIRSAWAAVAGETSALVHGDLSLANIRVAADGAPILLDWDEARRDAPSFDLAALAPDATPAATRALPAWGIAVSWHAEPRYARTLARRFDRA